MVVICELRKNHILGVYSGYTQVILRLYSLLRVCSDYSKGILRVYSRYTQGIPRVYSGYTQGVLRLYSGYTQAILRVYLGYTRSNTWGISTC